MPGSLRRSLILLLGAFLFLSGLSATTPARAAPSSGVTLRVESHFNGHFKFGEWLPLRVSLANDGPSLRTEVHADTIDSGGQTIYAVPVELPTGARKRLTLYVQPPSFAKAVRVRVMNETQELATQSLPLTVEKNVNYLVGVIAPRGEAFAALNSLKLSPGAQSTMKGPMQSVDREVHTLSIPLADIPDREEGLRMLDALVISGADTSELSQAQTRALQLWVEEGGRLVLGGGASAARTLAGLPDALVQDWRDIGSATELQSLTALGQFAGDPVRVSGPFVATFTRGGRTLIAQDSAALLVEKPVGEGYVDYCALDLAASPFDAWAGAQRFWGNLLTPGAAYPMGVPYDVSPRTMRLSQMANAMQYLPALDLPPIGALAALLAVYIILVGPVNYVILRRQRKLEWGWLTIPALTLLFSAGAFQLGFSLRGSDVIVNQISVLNLLSGEIAPPVQTLVGLYSPDRGTYTLQIGGGALLAPVNLEGNPFQSSNFASGSVGALMQGDPAQARDVRLEPGALDMLQTESSVPAGWEIESALTLDGNHLRGALTNRMSESIGDLVLVVGNHFARLSELKPGENKSIDLEMSTNEGTPFPYMLFEGQINVPRLDSSGRESQMRQQLLQGYYQSFNGMAQPPSRLTLIGWMHASPLDAQVANLRAAHNATSLVIATLNVEYPRGAVHITPGSLMPQLIETDGETGMCGPNNQLIVNNGHAVLAFQLPEELADLQVTRLVLSLQGGSAPAIELADREGHWIKLDNPKAGSNVLTDPARFLLNDGTVRVRVSSTGAQNSECVRYDLEIEGERK